MKMCVEDTAGYDATVVPIDFATHTTAALDKDVRDLMV